jgi:hypothetical protein
MPPTAAADATRVLLLQRHDLELGVRRWQQRLPRPGAIGSASDILDSISGALWLELAACAKPVEQRQRCLRRVLYHEFERDWRRPYVGLDSALPKLSVPQVSPESWLGPIDVSLDLPSHLLAWAHSYLDLGGPQGRLDRGAALCGSRRQTRLRNSAIFNNLADGRFRRDLQRRAARLLSAAALDGASPVHRQEAGAILCILKMLQPTPELTAMRQAVSNIVAQRKLADHAGTAESANA